MKKKLLTLFMALVLMLSNCMVTFAEGETQPSGSEALTAAKAGNAYIIDVRNQTARTDTGTLEHLNAKLPTGVANRFLHLQLFDSNGQINGTTETDTLAADFTAAVVDTTGNKLLEDLPIYILCNSGKSGAEKATKLLNAAKYTNVHTIKNGAKDLEILYAMLNVNNSIDGDVALEDAANPATKSIILDVRNDASRTKTGIIKNSIHVPVFNTNGPVVTLKADTLAADFVNKTKNFALGDDTTKIYILCNSGNSGARAATVLLEEAGYPKANLYTITGGASASGQLTDDLVKDVKVAKAQPIEGSKALAGIKDAGNPAYIIDLRAKVVHDLDNNNLDHLGSKVIHLPLFDKDNKLDTPDALANAKAFTHHVIANKATLKNASIYLLCNSGRSGAEKATQLLADAGYNVTADGKGQVYTITNGAKDLEIRYAMFESTDLGKSENGEDTLAITKVAENNAIILDVRNNANYKKLHVDGSVHIPVFAEDGSVVGTKDDSLAAAFIKAVENNTSLKEKQIYILCNSGQRGARAATVLLTDAKIPAANIHTIIGGAKDADIIKAATIDYQYVEGQKAVDAVGNSKILILDVRTKENFYKADGGHLKGSVSFPLFVGSTVDQTLVDNLTAYAKDAANASTFKIKDKDEYKDIYIMCNSGNSGAKNATKALLIAGIPFEKIHTIKEGAKGADVAAALTPYNFIEGKTSVDNAKDGKGIIIDVRSNKVHGKENNNLSYLETAGKAKHLVLFDKDNKLDTTEAAANIAAFKAAIKDSEDNKLLPADKPIYILCNSGNSGAKKATELLLAAGYDPANIYTIELGGKGLEMKYAFLGAAPTEPVDGEDAVKAAKDNDDNVVILDVRTESKYAYGHLKDSVSTPLFSSTGVVTTSDDKLSKAFTEYVNNNKDSLKDKDIYILCNSGNSGARAATVLLAEAGIPLAKIHTITGGAAGTSDDKSVPKALIYVSDKAAINATQEDDKLIIDVRNADKYADGHLKGSLSLPLFDANNKLDTEEAKALAEAFAAYVTENKTALEGKTIYILCNSGNRGADKALEILAAAGLTDNVFIIDGGATSPLFVNGTDYWLSTEEENAGTITDSDDSDDETKTDSVDTGDSTNIMPYALTMAFALLAIVLVGKKKFTK